MKSKFTKSQIVAAIEETGKRRSCAELKKFLQR
jgi:hypothetical protein